MARKARDSAPMPVAKSVDSGLVTLPPPAGSYLAWYDDTKGLGIIQKIVDAIGRYRHRFGVEASIAYINPADCSDEHGAITIVPPDGVELRVADRIPRNNVWVGKGESVVSAR
jgi:hypothetical protein